MRQARVRHLAWIGALLLLAVVARLFQLQVIEGDAWADEALLSRTEVRTVPFRRGSIRDRDGRVLAEDRFTHELHCNYREFRRGHPAGQLLEALLLVDREQGRPADGRGGLGAVLADAEALGAEVLAWRAEDLQGLPSRVRQDLSFYLRGMAGLDAPGMATEVLAWAHGGSGRFVDAFPDAQEGFLERVRAARVALEDLERSLGADTPEGGLLADIEAERRGLERHIQALLLDQALANALPETGARAAREALAEGGEEGDALLDALVARWCPEVDATGRELLRAVVTGTVEDPREVDRLRADLEAQIARAAPEDLVGVRRRLVLQVHNERVIRLVRDLGYAPADLVTQHAERYPGMFVQQVPDRIYPLDAAPHLVGRVGAIGDAEYDEYQVQRARFRELSRAFYRSEADEREYQELRHMFLARVRHPSEAGGERGVERAFEAVLRGERGYVQLVRGGESGERPLELVFQPPRDGRDVVLTLDVELQGAAEQAIRKAYEKALEALQERRRSGMLKSRFRNDPQRLQATLEALREPRAALVLIDLRDGALPVLATLPSYSRSIFSDVDAYARVAGDLTNAPMRQRALGGMPGGAQTPYPGSTFKLLVAAAALATDSAYLSWTAYCGKSLALEGGPPLNCEDYHDRIGMHEAIQKSCNIYFYRLAEELGYARVHDFAARLGFGRPTGIELVPVERGEDGSWRPGGPDARLEWEANGLEPPDRPSVRQTMRLGIGQTRIWCSPLQLARFYAWLATGRLPTPRLVREGGGASPAAPPEDPPMLAAAMRERLEAAMHDVVADPGGTAYDKDWPLDEFRVVGKTGTAQVGEGILVHAWFAGYFPADAPRYAFAVLCENSGLHGGEIASDALYHLLADDYRKAKSDRQLTDFRNDEE